MLAIAIAKITVVVVRYFSGIKLRTSRLVRSYTNSDQKILNLLNAKQKVLQNII
ncbi:MAG: YigZ family protein [Arsenophonus sp.]